MVTKQLISSKMKCVCLKTHFRIFCSKPNSSVKIKLSFRKTRFKSIRNLWLRAGFIIFVCALLARVRSDVTDSDLKVYRIGTFSGSLLVTTLDLRNMALLFIVAQVCVAFYIRDFYSCSHITVICSNLNWMNYER